MVFQIYDLLGLSKLGGVGSYPQCVLCVLIRKSLAHCEVIRYNLSNIFERLKSMKDKYYCPDCLNLLERYSGCGAVGYLCNTCKKLISRQKMLTYNQMINQSKKTNDTKSKD